MGDTPNIEGNEIGQPRGKCHVFQRRLICPGRTYGVYRDHFGQRVSPLLGPADVREDGASVIGGCAQCLDNGDAVLPDGSAGRLRLCPWHKPDFFPASAGGPSPAGHQSRRTGASHRHRQRSGGAHPRFHGLVAALAVCRLRRPSLFLPWPPMRPCCKSGLRRPTARIPRIPITFTRQATWVHSAPCLRIHS